jgi:hypothetical protein
MPENGLGVVSDAALERAAGGAATGRPRDVRHLPVRGHFQKLTRNQFYKLSTAPISIFYLELLIKWVSGRGIIRNLFICPSSAV